MRAHGLAAALLLGWSQGQLQVPDNPILPTDEADVLQTRPDLKLALVRWWGVDAYIESNRAMQLDLMKAGFDFRELALAGIVAALEHVLQRHASGTACSSLPKVVASHAWRYNQSELSTCIGAGPNSTGMAAAIGGCALRCEFLPEVAAHLSCQSDAAELSGHAPTGACRFARDLNTEVQIVQGALRGVERPILWRWEDSHQTVERTRAFWGVPYAEKPERFQPPKPLSTRWPGVRDVADGYAISTLGRMHCAGLSPIDDGTGSEDCLFLDLYTPAGAPPSEGWPVMVYFFGAGFVGGDAWRDGHYDGARFTIRNNVILVVLSYRVGFLGHWAHPALAKESGDGSVGNYGELDQRMALRWLQQNVRAFGGDPGRVTIVGHSSGAFDTVFHILSPSSKGLFSGVIVESATFDNPWYFQEKSQAYQFYAEIGEALGCPRDGDDDAATAAAGSRQMACVRTLPAQVLWNFTQTQIGLLSSRITGSKPSSVWIVLEALFAGIGLNRPIEEIGLLKGDSYITATPLWPLLPLGMVVDGSQSGLPGPPRELFAAGRVNDAQIWINHEADEGTLFAGMLLFSYPWYKTPALTHTAVGRILTWAFGGPNTTMAQQVLKAYPQGPFLGTTWPFARLSLAIGEGIFVCSARRTAQSLALRRPGSVFYAELTFRGSGVREHHLLPAILHKDIAYLLGAHHCEQPRWIFGSNGDWANWTATDQRMLQLVNCHYALMLHCGNPGDSECMQRLAASGQVLHACAALGPTPPPLPPYDPAKPGHRTILDPDPKLSQVVAPSREEDYHCAFWDAAPPVNLRPNNCRGCAATSSAPPQASIVI